MTLLHTYKLYLTICRLISFFFHMKWNIYVSNFYFVLNFQPSTEASLRSASALKNSRQRSTSECSETHPQPPPRKQKKQKKSVDFKAGLHRSLSESNVISSLRYGRPQPLEVNKQLMKCKQNFWNVFSRVFSTDHV